MFLFYSFCMGIFITFIYDILRILRRVFVHNGFFISLEDFIFWMYTTLRVFYMLQTQSNGTLRWFAVMGALFGMFLYKRLFSPFFVKWVSFILRKPVEFFGRHIGKISKKAGKKLTRLKKLLKITICKQ